MGTRFANMTEKEAMELLTKLRAYRDTAIVEAKGLTENIKTTDFSDFCTIADRLHELVKEARKHDKEYFRACTEYSKQFWTPCPYINPNTIIY